MENKHYNHSMKNQNKKRIRHYLAIYKTQKELNTELEASLKQKLREDRKDWTKPRQKLKPT